MRTPRVITVLLASIALFPLLLPAESFAADETPAVLEMVLALEGRWEGPASLTTGGKTHRFVYAMSYKKAAGGTGLLMEETADIPGIGSLQGVNVIGFDPYGGRLHWFSTDNFGTVHDHLGELVRPGHLRLVHESEREGKPFREVIDLHRLGRDRLQAKLTAMLGGEVTEVLEATFQRAGR